MRPTHRVRSGDEEVVSFLVLIEQRSHESVTRMLLTGDGF